MNLKNKPYSIYAHDMNGERKGLWFRLKSFHTMSSAVQSLKELTKTPKEERDFIYIVLPNQGEQRRHILFNEENIQKAIDSGR